MGDALIWACMMRKRQTWPQCSPGQASTLCSGEGDKATSPEGLLSVSVECSRRRSAKLYMSTLCSRATTILSRRSLTARTCACVHGAYALLDDTHAMIAGAYSQAHVVKIPTVLLASHLAPEAELAYAPALVIVPYHHLHRAHPSLFV